jgi:hypothetical protein
MTYKQQAKVNTIIGVFTLLLLVGIWVKGEVNRYEYNHRLISPVADGGISLAVVKTNQGQSPNWKETAQIIIEEFSKLEATVGKSRAREYTFQALQVFKHESNWEESAVNKYNKDGSWDGGCVQINSGNHVPAEIVFDCRASIIWAREQFVNNGYKWSTGRVWWASARTLGFR